MSVNTDVNTSEMTEEQKKQWIVDEILKNQKHAAEMEEKFKSTYSNPKWITTAEAKAHQEKSQADFEKITGEINELKKSHSDSEELIKQMNRSMHASPGRKESDAAEKTNAFFDHLRFGGVMHKKTQDPAIISMFMPNQNSMATYGKSISLGSDHEGKAYSTLNLAQAGTLTMPPEVLREIIDQNEREITNIRPYARVMRTSAGELTIPTQTAHGAAGWVAELGTKVVDQTAAFGTETMTLHEHYVYFQATYKMLNDPWMNIKELMMADYRSGASELQGTAFVIGSGVGQPEGFLTDSRSTEVNNGNASNIVDENGFKNVYFQLKAGYRGSARWIMNSNTMYRISILKDGSGQPLLRTLGESPEFNLLGKGVIASEDMPDVAAGTIPIVFADWSRYYGILDSVNAAAMIEDPYTNKLQNIVDFVLHLSVGGKVINPEAAKKYKVAS